MVDVEAKRKKDKTKEIVAYSITGGFWLGGLAICILGVYAYNGPGKISVNDIFQAQKRFSSWLNLSFMIDFRILGALVCLIAMCFFLGFIYHYAGKYERDEVRKAAQIQRLHQLIEEDKKKQEADIVKMKEIQNEIKKTQQEAEADKVGPLPPTDKSK